MNKSIIIIIALLCAWYFMKDVSSPNFNGTTLAQTTDLANLTSQITADKSGAKYKHIEPFTKNGITYRVDEYDGPKGTGYWITMTKIEKVSQFNATTSKNELVDKVLTKVVSSDSKYNVDWQ